QPPGRQHLRHEAGVAALELAPPALAAVVREDAAAGRVGRERPHRLRPGVAARGVPGVEERLAAGEAPGEDGELLGAAGGGGGGRRGWAGGRGGARPGRVPVRVRRAACAPYPRRAGYGQQEELSRAAAVSPAAPRPPAARGRAPRPARAAAAGPAAARAAAP